MIEPTVIDRTMDLRMRRPRQCLFCDGKPNSGEHFWPEHLQTVLKPKNKRTVHKRIERTLLPTGEVKTVFSRGALDQAGDPLTRTGRVVCASCNNDWMNRLQARAVPTLKALLLDENPILSQTAQLSLSALVVLSAMVMWAEMREAHAISREEHLTFYEHQRPDAAWRVWVAGYEGVYSPGSGWTRWLSGAEPIDGQAPDAFAFSQIRVLGNLVFLVHYSQLAKARIPPLGFERNLGLRRIWPSTPRGMRASLTSLDDDGCARAVCAMGRYYQDMPY